jgi:hypothetical protein
VARRVNVILVDLRFRHLRRDYRAGIAALVVVALLETAPARPCGALGSTDARRPPAATGIRSSRHGDARLPAARAGDRPVHLPCAATTGGGFAAGLPAIAI